MFVIDPNGRSVSQDIIKSNNLIHTLCKHFRYETFPLQDPLPYVKWVKRYNFIYIYIYVAIHIYIYTYVYMYIYITLVTPMLNYMFIIRIEVISSTRCGGSCTINILCSVRHQGCWIAWAIIMLSLL